MKPVLHLKRAGTDRTLCGRRLLPPYTLPGLQNSIVWRGRRQCTKCLDAYGRILVKRGDDVL